VLADLLADHRLSAYALAKAMHVPVNRVTAIAKGRRAITADTAIRLGRALGTSAEMWLGLQAACDLAAARRKCVGADVEPVAQVAGVGDDDV
jgi:addiction module HigA family antidote